MADRILIIDIEASGLGQTSFPIEIGLAALDDDFTWSALIRPDPDWTDDEWDEIAAELHGLTPVQLQREGRPAHDVARDLWAVIAQCELFCDAPVQDGHWLERLRQTTWPVPEPIAVRHVAELLPAPPLGFV